MSKTRTCWLSVDYDYFVRSLLDWDWGHQESPFFRGGFIWATRVAPFLARGMDLVAEMNPEEHARPLPLNFWSVLEQLGYNFNNVGAYVVADSHSGAGPFFNQLAESGWEEPADVLVNFDAHHDLGYCEWARIRKLAEEGTCTCDMWLGALLSWCPELEARIVLPDWLQKDSTLQEQIQSVRKNLPKGIWSRVEMGFFTEPDGTVSDVVSAGDEELEVTAVFVCRSGAWVPPWLDKHFIDFVDAGVDEIGLEPDDAFADRDVPALEPRSDFSMAEAKKLGEQWRLLMEHGVEAANEFAKKHDED